MHRQLSPSTWNMLEATFMRLNYLQVKLRNFNIRTKFVFKWNSTKVKLSVILWNDDRQTDQLTKHETLYWSNSSNKSSIKIEYQNSVSCRQASEYSPYRKDIFWEAGGPFEIFSILNPITSLVIPENFLFSLKFPNIFGFIAAMSYWHVY